ncbi:putative sulfoacetate transporter SauU [Bremerella volcania]|uniref:Putative sulfoacetate transporter SauU n=1 Tax=Bremerella volcania TaxID=2527984 RepID=A0A518C990_9BACT|nr:MFS transporter [Bremerella volcania]QDU75789.1 putative sulfoacetate transporter SauU [Bremerella volcania]
MYIRRTHMIVGGTFALSVLLYVDRICISAAAVQMENDLLLSRQQMGWAMSAFALGYALFQTPGGWLADRFGPRRILAAIVVSWSIFTGLTGLVFGFVPLLVTRFLFGAGEAGAFPGMSRAVFSWIPMDNRGLVQGINFSGSRLGAAFALPIIAMLIASLGWRNCFLLLMVVGFLWAIGWYWFFRDDPAEHPTIASWERDEILATRQIPSKQDHATDQGLANAMLRSRNMWLISLQYFCSNFTFFFCLTWLFPHLKETYSLSTLEAGLYSSAPLICGAMGNWLSGWLVDRIYRNGSWTWSRRGPAILGFACAAIGLVCGVWANSPWSSILFFSLAIFGADMTLAPSWSFCIDIGKRNSGVVSGTMNMAGNVGSFITALAFPYLAAWTGSNVPFFFLAAGLSVIAILAWLGVNPHRSLQPVESRTAEKVMCVS